MKKLLTALIALNFLTAQAAHANFIEQVRENQVPQAGNTEGLRMLKNLEKCWVHDICAKSEIKPKAKAKSKIKAKK